MKISKNKLIKIIKEVYEEQSPWSDKYKNPYGDDDAELPIGSEKEDKNYNAADEDAKNNARLAAMQAEPPNVDAIADMAFNNGLSLPEIIAHYVKHGHSKDDVMSAIAADKLLRTQLIPVESMSKNKLNKIIKEQKMKINENKLNKIIKEETAKILNESAWAPEATLPANTMDDGPLGIPKYGESKEDKREIMKQIMAAIDEADLEELEKLSTMLDAGMRGMSEAMGTMGAVALGVAGATAALGIYDLIKSYMKAKGGSPAMAGGVFFDDPELSAIRAYIDKNIAKADSLRRRPPGDPPQDMKQAILTKKFNNLKKMRKAEMEGGGEVEFD